MALLKNDITTVMGNIDPYEALANGIILQACDDYLKGFITENSFKFFCYGEWIKLLTKVDGDFIYKCMRGRKDDRKRNKIKN